MSDDEATEIMLMMMMIVDVRKAREERSTDREGRTDRLGTTSSHL